MVAPFRTVRPTKVLLVALQNDAVESWDDDDDAKVGALDIAIAVDAANGVPVAFVVVSDEIVEGERVEEEDIEEIVVDKAD